MCRKLFYDWCKKSHLFSCHTHTPHPGHHILSNYKDWSNRGDEGMDNGHAYRQKCRKVGTRKVPPVATTSASLIYTFALRRQVY